MTDDIVDAVDSRADSVKPESRMVGCAFILLTWSLLTSLVALLTFVVFPNVGVIFLTFICILTLGFMTALLLGLWLGPRVWPTFYLWIESRPVTIAVIPGAIVGLFAALAGIWVPALYMDSQATGSGAGATLIAMFILSPAALLIAPVIGAVGGLLGGRFGSQTRSAVLIYGAIGGGIAGLGSGVLPYGAMWLYSLMTRSPL